MTAPHLKKPEALAEDDVSDLPLIELRVSQPTVLLAIVISGDDGWRDLDKTMALALQKDGVSVVGIDSLCYSGARSRCQKTASDLAHVIRTYNARWHTSHVALLGYSFIRRGCHAVYVQPPAGRGTRSGSYISLMGFSLDADFQIRVTDWLGMKASEKALQVRPEFAKLPPADGAVYL